MILQFSRMMEGNNLLLNLPQYPNAQDFAKQIAPRKMWLKLMQRAGAGMAVLAVASSVYCFTQSEKEGALSAGFGFLAAATGSALIAHTNRQRLAFYTEIEGRLQQGGVTSALAATRAAAKGQIYTPPQQ